MVTPLYQLKAEFFKTLGHPARIRVLELLAEREQAVGELLAEVGIEAASCPSSSRCCAKPTSWPPAVRAPTCTTGSPAPTSPNSCASPAASCPVSCRARPISWPTCAPPAGNSRPGALRRRPSSVVRGSPGASDTGRRPLPSFFGPPARRGVLTGAGHQTTAGERSAADAQDRALARALARQRQQARAADKTPRFTLQCGDARHRHAPRHGSPNRPTPREAPSGRPTEPAAGTPPRHPDRREHAALLFARGAAPQVVPGRRGPRLRCHGRALLGECGYFWACWPR